MYNKTVIFGKIMSYVHKFMLFIGDDDFDVFRFAGKIPSWKRVNVQ